MRTPFSRNNVKFGWVYLLENLKEIIVNHMQGEQRRDVQAMVPRPTQLSSAKPMPTIGENLCDALRNKEVALADEQKRLNCLHYKEGIPCRREEMPDFDSLQGKRVYFLCNEEENNNSDIGQCVMMCYFGRVERVMNKRGTGENKSCTAMIE